jgi:hypothetical protein
LTRNHEAECRRLYAFGGQTEATLEVLLGPHLPDFVLYAGSRELDDDALLEEGLRYGLAPLP